MKFRFITADVFTDRVFGGNQLAVFPDGRGLNTAQMQTIAREFNLSETVFAFPPGDPANTRALRIFTPGNELPFAGHPTVGTAVVLAAVGEVASTGDVTQIRFEEGVGVVPVSIRSRGGTPHFAELTAAKLPESGPPPPTREALAAVLSLDTHDLLEEPWAPQAFTCGVRYLFIPLRNRDCVKRARVRLDQWESTLSRWWAPEMYVFSRDPERAGSDIRARMFAPGFSLAEDPATGSAAAALAGYLARRDRRSDATLRWVVEQGFEMGRPSILHVSADRANGAITAVRVGGDAVLVSEGTFDVPLEG